MSRRIKNPIPDGPRPGNFEWPGKIYYEGKATTQKEYAENWERIFGRKGEKKEEPE